MGTIGELTCCDQPMSYIPISNRIDIILAILALEKRYTLIFRQDGPKSCGMRPKVPVVPVVRVKNVHLISVLMYPLTVLLTYRSLLIGLIRIRTCDLRNYFFYSSTKLRIIFIISLQCGDVFKRKDPPIVTDL